MPRMGSDTVAVARLKRRIEEFRRLEVKLAESGADIALLAAVRELLMEAEAELDEQLARDTLSRPLACDPRRLLVRPAQETRAGHLPDARALPRLDCFRTRQPLDDIRYRELRSARELRDGDQVFLDELLMRVRAVLSPNDNQHDGLLICGPDES